MFIKSLYILKASNSFKIELNKEVTVNLGLKKIPPCFHTLLAGCVFNKNLPLKNATVLVFDKCFKPMFHAVTNEYGVYQFRNLLRPGEYNIIAKAKGYKTSVSKHIQIKSNKIIKLSFSLKKELPFRNGIVYGKIFDERCKKAIKNVTVCLVSYMDNCKIIYKAQTNCCGQYLIYNILPGKYKMIIKKQGYKSSNQIRLTISSDDCMALNIGLLRNCIENNL